MEMTSGQWVYRLGRRCAADFIALLEQIRLAVPDAPAIVVICDNDSIHHAKAVTACLSEHPTMELLFGARYSPHDNPVERIRAALKAFIANTAVSWPGRRRQIHAFFRTRSVSATCSGPAKATPTVSTHGSPPPAPPICLTCIPSPAASIRTATPCAPPSPCPSTTAALKA
ncbi:hypothetical protein E1286_04695 [Nonomuraea terrae]|uniref:Tc1-like transposase DDE domain-containing protein n=1 Tax=Nonomuraea terrae TaxID=2530383 RepID=A0A4R4ZAZ7_9ACTN|nr:hypothetical protein E1286_04695 [Nonomuraea terrae]